MGIIKCNAHGENVISFSSQFHVNKALDKKLADKEDIVYVEIFDSEELLNGTFLVDQKIIKDLNIIDQRIDFQKEPEKYEKMMELLIPICSKCLNTYLK